VPTGEGKAVSLKRIGLDRPDAVFGNSCTICDARDGALRISVNPSPALMAAAAERGWAASLPHRRGRGVAVAENNAIQSTI